MKKIVLLFVALIAANFGKAQQERPNIIWLMAEDMSLDLECYGMPAVKTPNLNQLAEEGVRFDNCFVTNSICSPSRSAMMVGTHQRLINAHHHRSNRDVPLNKNFVPFTKLLRDVGYTCILGHHRVMNRGRKIDVNFKHQAIGEWDGITKFGLFDKYDDFDKKDQPFFAQIQLAASHRGDWWNDIRKQSKHPVNPDSVVLPEYLADNPVIRLDWAKYLDQIEYLDHEIGQIEQELKEKGMADNTIIIFIGDNGRCNVKGKGYLYDSGLRIPLIVYSPIGLQSKKVRKDVVSSTDITATILDMAGVKIPDFMKGKPIFSPNFERKFVYAARDLWDEIKDQSSGVTSDRWKYIRNDKPEIPYDAHQAYLEFYRPAVHVMRKLKAEGKLNAVQKQFFADCKPNEELYDLKNDPEELHNLVEEVKYQKVLNQLRKETENLDKKFTSVDTVYHSVYPGAVDVLSWVKETKPELYQQMLNGVEIGFHHLSSEYRKMSKMKSRVK